MAIKKIMKNPIFEKRLLKVSGSLSVGEAFLTLNAPDIYYLTGCTGSNNHLLITPNDIFIFTDGRYFSQISEQSQVSFTLMELSPVVSFGQSLKQVLSQNDVKHLRFAGDGMSYFQGKAVIEALPEGAQVAQDGLVTQNRMIK
ncbi:MAG: aminopeptidase P family N-terminal domain-containing protein, partial [Brevinema sp.]